MFEKNWRIRKDVCHMLGELLHRVGGGRVSYNPMDSAVEGVTEAEAAAAAGGDDEEEEGEDDEEYDEEDDEEDEDGPVRVNTGGGNNRIMSSHELLARMERHLTQPILHRL